MAKRSTTDIGRSKKIGETQIIRRGILELRPPQAFKGTTSIPPKKGRQRARGSGINLFKFEDVLQRPEETLMLAVLQRAMDDMFDNSRTVRKDAKEFFRNKSTQDHFLAFENICSCLDLNKDVILKLVTDKPKPLKVPVTPSILTSRIVALN